MQQNSSSQTETFFRTHRLDEYIKLAPGYRDGGRKIAFDDKGAPRGTPSREILVLKAPADDPALKQVIDDLIQQTERLPDREQKVRHIAATIRTLLGANGAEDIEQATTDKLAQITGGPSAGREVTLGQVIEGGAGVCRHRALLFKVIADEMGIPAALVRGNYDNGKSAGGHAWNEVRLENGWRMLVDASLGQVCDLNSPLTSHYKTVRNEPIYVNGFFIHHPLPVLFNKQADQNSSLHIIKSCKPLQTNNGLYLDISKETDERRQIIKDALRANKITFHQKRSSLDGGKDVLVVGLEGEQKLKAIITGQAEAAPISFKTASHSEIKLDKDALLDAGNAQPAPPPPPKKGIFDRFKL